MTFDSSSCSCIVFSIPGIFLDISETVITSSLYEKTIWTEIIAEANIADLQVADSQFVDLFFLTSWSLTFHNLLYLFWIKIFTIWPKLN